MNDFDDQHPAGADISEYFRIKDQYNYLSLDQYLDRRNSFNWLSDICLDCLLMSAPSITGTHQFQVEAKLSDGRTMLSTTTQILLQ